MGPKKAKKAAVPQGQGRGKLVRAVSPIKQTEEEDNSVTAATQEFYKERAKEIGYMLTYLGEMTTSLDGESSNYKAMLTGIVNFLHGIMTTVGVEISEASLVNASRKLVQEIFKLQESDFNQAISGDNAKAILIQQHADKLASVVRQHHVEAQAESKKRAVPTTPAEPFTPKKVAKTELGDVHGSAPRNSLMGSPQRSSGLRGIIDAASPKRPRFDAVVGSTGTKRGVAGAKKLAIPDSKDGESSEEEDSEMGFN